MAIRHFHLYEFLYVDIYELAAKLTGVGAGTQTLTAPIRHILRSVKISPMATSGMQFDGTHHHVPECRCWYTLVLSQAKQDRYALSLGAPRQTYIYPVLWENGTRSLKFEDRNKQSHSIVPYKNGFDNISFLPFF